MRQDAAGAQQRGARARDLGIAVAGEPGRHNAITDVPGVLVGHVTLIDGDGSLKVGSGPVRTGVTAILPRGHDDAHLACAAGRADLNGNGELTGTHWIDEAGIIAAPILLTNTFAVGSAHRGAVDWFVQRFPDKPWTFPVVGETFDGYLNDIAGSHVQPRHAVSAIESAASGPVPEGSIGGGTGMNCYNFKGGAGTASRVVQFAEEVFHIGVYVQANFGAREELTVDGRLVGPLLSTPNPMRDDGWSLASGSGSVIVVVATDAPLLPGQCSALARRATIGLARTGTNGSHHSGDIFLAFSVANPGAFDSSHPRLEPSEARLETVSFVPWGHLDALLTAAVQATEEAVLNALTANADMTGRDGNWTPALPHAELMSLIGRNVDHTRATGESDGA